MYFSHFSVKMLSSDLKPKGVVVSMIPTLPAYILFMCVRHADYLNDDAKLKSLMNGIIVAVKKVIMVRKTGCGFVVYSCNQR